MALFISSLLRLMMFSLVLAVLFVKPAYAVVSEAAEQDSAASLDEGSMIDESMDDEDVEDIDASMPDNETLNKTVNNDTKTTDSEKATKIAPNIDLKEVAPTPTIIEEDKAVDEATVEPEASPTPTPLVPLPTDEPTAKPVNESITLFNTEVLPNTSTRLAWSSGIQIAGLAQPTPVLVVNGAHPGPTLCLTATIHGDELNGIEIIRRTVYDLDPQELSGAVIGIPIVNLQGFQQGSRYLPDRRDLNRYFPGTPKGSLADRVAYSLFQQVIVNCDMLVDIHTGSFRRNNLPQLRADMHIEEIARFTLGFDGIAVVHSVGNPGMLRSAAVDAGIVAVTLEVGESLRIQEDEIKAGVKSLNSLMEKQKMISRFFVWGQPETVYYNSYWLRAEHGGILFSQVELGDSVKPGDILGIVSDPITNTEYTIVANTEGRIIGMAVDQVVMAGFAAYHLGTKAEIPSETKKINESTNLMSSD
jgi:predicted deacylase